jgi:hypothetical protein
MRLTKMIENKKLHKYLDELTKINDVIIERQDKERALAEKERKHKERLEYLRYQSIHNCLINIMTEKKLLEAVQKYGEAKGNKAHMIKFAEGGGSNPSHICYDHLAIDPHKAHLSEINFRSSTKNPIKFYIALRDHHKEGNITYSELYIEKNKVYFEYYTNTYSAAHAILPEDDRSKTPDVIQHDAQSIVKSLENSLKELLSEYTK